MSRRNVLKMLELSPIGGRLQQAPHGIARGSNPVILYADTCSSKSATTTTAEFLSLEQVKELVPVSRAKNFRRKFSDCSNRKLNFSLSVEPTSEISDKTCSDNNGPELLEAKELISRQRKRNRDSAQAFVGPHSSRKQRSHPPSLSLREHKTGSSTK